MKRPGSRPPRSEPAAKEKRSRSLRKRAESVWRSGTDLSGASTKEVARLVHELGVHQIELEMQNEELRRAQAELEESRNHWLDVYEFAPVGYLTLDEQAIIQEANLRAAALFHIPRGRLPGKHFRSLVAPESKAAFNVFWRALNKGTRQVSELSLRGPDDTQLWSSLEAAERREADGRRFWRCAVTDITALKRAENESRASEQRLQSYMDHAADAIFVLDGPGGRILNANQRAVAMLGYSREELLTMSAVEIEVAHPSRAMRAAHQRPLSGVVEREGVHRRKDGSTFPVEMRLTSLAPAQPEAVLAVVRDITEWKRLEEELARETQRKDEFLALLGHELRNPLAAISSSLDVLPGSGPAQRADLEALMRRQAGLMRRLLDDLLDLNRIGHGRIELQKEGIDLAEFVREMARNAQATFTERAQELVVRVPARPLTFLADRVRLEQIVANLLSNASKYTGTGGRIELSGGREGSEIVLRCKDNGQGIAPEDVETIFQPFVTGRRTAYGYGEASLGIGLALVKQLTELHGGTVSVKSAGAGQGSEFIVRLPLVAPAPVRAVSAAARAGVRQRPLTVVLVEDNPNVAAPMKIALEQAGNAVHTFSDGASALAGLGELRADAALLDIGLPGMDGYELAARLRQRPGMRDAVFVAISGFGKKELAGRPGDDFDYYLTKPVDVAALVELLDKAVPAVREKRKPARTTRVLLVEDHADLAAVMAKLLREEGLEVRTALTGGEGLRKAAEFRPHLVLCDMNLPDIKGLEVIRRLRGDPATKSAYAVILTARTPLEIRTFNREAGRLGVDEFVSKPITAEAIGALKATVEARDAGRG